MKITIRDVERAVCLRFQISRAELLRRSTSRAASRPRQIAMYLARELTGASFPRLGQHFDRDHSSVFYACRQTVARMAADARLATDIEGCREIVEKRGPWKEAAARNLAERGLWVAQ